MNSGGNITEGITLWTWGQPIRRPLVKEIPEVVVTIHLSVARHCPMMEWRDLCFPDSGSRRHGGLDLANKMGKGSASGFRAKRSSASFL